MSALLSDLVQAGAQTLTQIGRVDLYASEYGG